MLNLKQKIVDLKGKELEIAYGETIAEILLAPAQDPGESKYRCYSMAQKLHSRDEIELDKEEKLFILQKAERVAPPLIYGRIRDFLNPEAESDKKKEPIE